MAVVDLRAFCNVALAVLINCKYSLSEQQATTLLLQFQETLVSLLCYQGICNPLF